MTARKYVLTRIEKGDYLLPSNDGRTLWRIRSYTEYGDAMLDDGSTLRGTFWEAWKYPHPFDFDTELGDDFLDVDKWEPWSLCYRSRAEAIEDCLRERVVA